MYYQLKRAKPLNRFEKWCRDSSVELWNRKRASVLKFKRHLLYISLSLPLSHSPMVWPNDNISLPFSSLFFVVLYFVLLEMELQWYPSNHLIFRQKSTSGSHTHIVTHAQCTNFSPTNTHLHQISYMIWLMDIYGPMGRISKTLSNLENTVVFRVKRSIWSIVIHPSSLINFTCDVWHAPPEVQCG